MKELEKSLLNNLVMDGEQGYAFYFDSPEFKVEEYNGIERLGYEKKIDANTNFRLASITKQFVAYGILRLIEQELLSFDSKLFDMFDGMPQYTKEIEIKQLLNHTSGIIDFEDMEHGEEQVRDADVLDFVKQQQGTYFKPSTDFRYSNTGYIVLGLIIEKISGKSLAEFIKAEVFDRAGMNDSYVNTQGITKIKNRAYGTALENGALVERDQSWMSATIGDGGVYSSINDLKKWLNFLNADSLAQTMFKSTTDTDYENVGYGYGFRVGSYRNVKVIYHTGITCGTNGVLGFVPLKKIKFIFLTNLNDIVPKTLMQNLIRSKMLD